MASEVCAILVFTDWINLLYRLDYLATLLTARITSYDLLWSPFGICWQGVLHTFAYGYKALRSIFDSIKGSLPVAKNVCKN